MRFSELFGPTAVEIAAILLSISTVDAANFNPVSPPNLDLSRQGRVALAGDFDSISLYTYEGQNQNGFTTNGSQSLLQQLPNGVFATLQTSDAMIMAMCPFVRRDNTLAGVVVGGNFTSLGGQAAQGAALINPETSEVVPLTGLNGSVNALFCDPERDTVFVGGDFQGLNSTNAIAWVGMDGWANLPFVGFNGPVNSISKAPNGNIVWGGSFTGTGNMSTPANEDQQLINLQTANITAGPEGSQDGFSDPRNIVCSSGEGPGSAWLAGDTVGAVDFNFGFWRADFGFGFEPKTLRLKNTNQEGRATTAFRFQAFPLNGIMNFTYTNSETGANESCTNFCPLSTTTDEYQEFTFVNTVGMNSIQIDIRGIEGNGGGFGGIELLQDDIYAYAVPEFNAPSCANLEFASNSTQTGPWSVSPSGNSASQYLTADLSGADANANDDVEVTFVPDIRQDGNYTVTIFTPGCQQDNSCDRRGRANVTIFPTSDQQNVESQMVYQTNTFDKYDQIYTGPIDASSGSFRPTVVITPWNEEPRAQSLVALRVRFSLLDPSSTGLNGIYEYDPDRLASQRLTNSTFIAAGEDLNRRARVNTLAVIDGTTYVGGNFSNNEITHMFEVPDNSNATSVAGGGLNQAVNHFFAFGNQLFVGGNFTNTVDETADDLQHVGWYDVSDRTWHALGAGVNGPVERLVPLSLNTSDGQPETCITVSGHFDQVRASGDNPSFDAPGFAIWVPSAREWLQNTGIQSLAIQGQLTAATNITDNPPLLAGTIQSQGWALTDAVALSSQDGNVNVSPIGLREPPTVAGQQTLRKRDTISQNVTGAVTGLFVTDDNRNLTVLAGQFEALDSEENLIRNVALITTDGDGRTTTRGLSQGIEESSIFRSVAREGNTLSLGGEVAGTINDGEVRGFVQWDLGSQSWVSPQPPPLDGDTVAVYSITTRPSSQDLYVAGNFSGAGSLQCPGICVYSNGDWNRPGQDIDGTITNMVWQGNNQLLVAGNLSVAGNTSYLGTYEVDNNQAWSVPQGADAVPGPVTALTPASGDASEYWIAGNNVENGTAYLVKFQETFQVVSNIFAEGTVVRGLSVVSTSEDHDANDLLEERLTLMITGTINVPNFGNASAVLFDGNNLTPLILSNSGNNQGSISQIIVERQQNFSEANGGMRVGYIVAIALAIALGLMGLLILAGLLIERKRRASEGYRPAPQNYFEKTANMGRIPPERLFSSLNQPSAPQIGA